MRLSGGNQLIRAEDVINPLNLRAGAQLADLGCGAAGHFTLPAAKAVGETGVVWAVDILKSALEEIANRAKMENLKNIRTVWSNIEQYGATNIPPKSVDVVLLKNVLFQSKQHREILAEAMRLVKPGGKIVIIEWKTSATPLGPPPEYRIAPEHIRALALQAGLKELTTLNPGPYHYGFIFLAP